MSRLILSKSGRVYQMRASRYRPSRATFTRCFLARNTEKYATPAIDISKYRTGKVACGNLGAFFKALSADEKTIKFFGKRTSCWETFSLSPVVSWAWSLKRCSLHTRSRREKKQWNNNRKTDAAIYFFSRMDRTFLLSFPVILFPCLREKLVFLYTAITQAYFQSGLWRHWVMVVKINRMKTSQNDGIWIGEPMKARLERARRKLSAG